jgi:hypothetical protein
MQNHQKIDNAMDFKTNQIKSQKITFFSTALFLITAMQASCWGITNTFELGLMIPAFCQAISSRVLPSKEVCSRWRDVMPTSSVFLEWNRNFSWGNVFLSQSELPHDIR